MPHWVRWLLALLPLRIALMGFPPLLPEEAYHWNFARHLDWSYYDHPPMIAWAIWAGRLFLGDSPFAIRFVPLLFSIGTTVVLARLAKRVYGDAAAVWAVLLFTLMPVALPVSESGFPDSPLLFFWALTMALVWQALEEGKPRLWIAAGAALGAAMLSKYTAIMLVPAVFLQLVLSPRDRKWLATPWPWLAGLVALLVFTPVIYWNATHGWASFLFQSKGRFEESKGVEPRLALRYLWTQALAAFALTLPLAVVTIRRLIRAPRIEERFFLYLLLPIFGAFLAVSFVRPAHVLWPLPGYLGLIVAMAGSVSQAAEPVARFYLAWRNRLVAVSALAILGAGAHLAFFLPYLSPMQGPYGWGQVAEAARKLWDGPRKTFFLATGRKYTCTSQLAYHLRMAYHVHGANLLGEPALQYGYWVNPADLKGLDAVVVIEGELRMRETLDELALYFESFEPAGDLSIPVGRNTLRPSPPLTFHLFKAKSYRPR